MPEEAKAPCLDSSCAGEPARSRTPTFVTEFVTSKSGRQKKLHLASTKKGRTEIKKERGLKGKENWRLLPALAVR